MTVSHRTFIKGLVASGAAISVFSSILANTGKWHLGASYTPPP